MRSATTTELVGENIRSDTNILYLVVVLVSSPIVLWSFGWKPQFWWRKSREIGVLGGFCRRPNYTLRVSFGGSGLGGIRAAWDQGTKWEQGR